MNKKLFKKKKEISVESSDEGTAPLNRSLAETDKMNDENENENDEGGLEDDENENVSEENGEEKGIIMLANEMNEDNDIEIENEIVKSGKEKEMYEYEASGDDDHSEFTENGENGENGEASSDNEKSSNKLDKSGEGAVGILENIQDKKRNEQESGGRTRTKFPNTAANKDRGVELAEQRA